MIGHAVKLQAYTYFIDKYVKPMCRKIKIVIISRSQSVEFKFKYLD